MKSALMGVMAVLALTACDTKKEDVPKNASTALRVCPGGGGEVVLTADAPKAATVHRNNAGCILEYLAGFEADPLNGNKPSEEQANLCTSIARAALVVKSDLDSGKPLQEALATVAENGNPMVARSLAKVVNHVYSHPEQSGEAAKAQLEEQCRKHPRSFYLITGEEVKKYRVLNGPPSPEEMADAEVQKIIAQASKPDSAKSLDEHVQDCVTEATRDKSVLAGVTNVEIEAACRAGLSR